MTNVKKEHTVPQSTGTGSVTPATTPRKKVFFWGVMLLFPVLLIALLELSLHLAGYGGNFDLVIHKSLAGRDYYILNRELAKRYFTSRDAVIPEASDEPFAVHKGTHTKRIFMLGESTMAGFPYDYNATAPNLLRDRLSLMFPNDTVEVINAGLSAINSYVVRDMIKDLVRYEPDAFVVYLGHNEFYGPFGVGSSQYLGKSRFAVNLFIAMRDFRTMTLVRDALLWFRGLSSPVSPSHNPTLMEAMIGKNSIPYRSADYNTALENFEGNYRDIIEIAKAHAIPIVISTMASNIRDQRPLMACFQESTPQSLREEWKQHFTTGVDAFKKGDFAKTRTELERCISIDSTNADAQYDLGLLQDSLGEFDAAYLSYRQARDFDGMRFRASTDWNNLIRKIAADEQVPLADADHDFELQSPHKLIGGNLMLEHLHPNANGYFLLAKTFASALQNNHVAGFGSTGSLPVPSDEYLKIFSGVTQFDLEVGSYKIYGLTHRWPFIPSAEPPVMPKPASFIQDIAFKYAKGSIAWSDARYALADAYKSQHRYAEAMREYFAVSKIAWYSYYPLMQMGDVARLMETPDTAESCYQRGLQRQDTPFLHVRLGMLYYDRGRLNDAIREFEQTFVSDDAAKEPLDQGGRSMARYLLAVTYGKSGNLLKAKQNLQLAVQIDPRNREAATMLSQLH